MLLLGLLLLQLFLFSLLASLFSLICVYGTGLSTVSGLGSCVQHNLNFNVGLVWKISKGFDLTSCLTLSGISDIVSQTASFFGDAAKNVK